MSHAALEAALRRDRVVVAAALLILIMLAWAYVLWLAADMRMGGMDMTGYRMVPAGAGLMTTAIEPWQAIEFAFVFAMWAVMMVGMMTPSVAPLILLYARVGRQAALERTPFPATSWLAGGYLAAWLGFSLVATLAQWALDRAGWLTPSMAGQSMVFSGFVLIAAGLYQWTPVKNACLRQCQSPLQFIFRHGGFRATAADSFVLGARHGAYCVGCCWVLMTLLFVGGVMNVLWIAAITAFVLLEKLGPEEPLLPRVSGLLLVLAGAWLSFAA